MIKIRVMQADGFDDPLSYNMSIAIKNEKNLEILDTQFKFSNLENKKLIYTHTKEEPLMAVSYTHLRAHETDSYLVCRLLLEKKKVVT